MSCLLNLCQFVRFPREFLRTSTSARNLIGQSIVAIPTFGGNDLHLQGKQPLNSFIFLKCNLSSVYCSYMRQIFLLSLSVEHFVTCER